MLATPTTTTHTTRTMKTTHTTRTLPSASAFRHSGFFPIPCLLTLALSALQPFNPSALSQPSLDVFPHNNASGEIATFGTGVKLFTNRNHTLAKPPAALVGMKFLRVPIEGMEIRCTKPGELLVLTPPEGKDSLASSLLAQGFARDTRTQDFQLVVSIPKNRVTLHRKTLKAGETLKLGLYSIVLGFDSATFKRTELDLTEAGLKAAVVNRTWQGIPGLERTDAGRLFFTWFTGDTHEPRPENIVLLCHSDDGGKTHSSLQIMGVPFKDGTRAFDPVPWIDPKGRLWYFFQRGNSNPGTHGLYARICENPDAPAPAFGPEFQIDLGVPFAFGLNKPTVLSTGEWLKPVTYANKPIPNWRYSKERQLHGVGISHDEGKTWKLHGAVEAPPWELENMIIELKDGRLWMLIRTKAGHLWESFSTDKGVTWSNGKRSKIESPGSRFFIRRLSSGNLLLVNHYNFERDSKGAGRRSHLTAQISTDDGRTWGAGLLLDARAGVSYPDGVEDKDGLIWITYDYDRKGSRDSDGTGYGYILMAKFREEDAMQGKNASGDVVLRHVINRLPGKKKQIKN